MWLINAHTLRLEEFLGEKAKEYVILSHRWEDDEVSFKDMQNLDLAASKKGFEKIRKTCELAIRDGYEYAWVDTCCINKESSTELSEAINSMFQWYEAAAVCYAFLSDVKVGEELGNSVWFQRGWTLQELLAPRKVNFCDGLWHWIGTKGTLSKIIAQRTGIDEAALAGRDLSQYSIAQRMSWASKRVTTRIEDLSYCLLGLFEVNMPLLYGEGPKAFMRLQEEIIKQSDDHSIFAWPMLYDHSGLLTSSPFVFAQCYRVRVYTLRSGHSPYSMTNRGLSCRFVAKPLVPDTYLVRLDCTNDLVSLPKNGDATQYNIGIFLRRLYEDDQYARVTHNGQSLVCLAAEDWDEMPSSRSFSQQELEEVQKRRSKFPCFINVNVRQRFSSLVHSSTYKPHHNGFRIIIPGLLPSSDMGDQPSENLKILDCHWDAQDQLMHLQPGRYGYVGTIEMSPQNSYITHVKLGFDFEYNPICFLADLGADNYIHGGRKFSSQDIPHRLPFNMDDWSEIALEGHILCAWDLQGYPGLWALKGDRRDGLNVRLVKKGDEPTSDNCEVIIVRGILRDRMVWNVHLRNTRWNGTRALKISPSLRHKYTMGSY
ncbi:MAG: hypothetical protein Q9169_003087 [Polycauliona sp. 2 TL-2023]